MWFKEHGYAKRKPAASRLVEAIHEAAEKLSPTKLTKFCGFLRKNISSSGETAAQYDTSLTTKAGKLKKGREKFEQAYREICQVWEWCEIEGPLNGVPLDQVDFSEGVKAMKSKIDDLELDESQYKDLLRLWIGERMGGRSVMSKAG